MTQKLVLNGPLGDMKEEELVTSEKDAKWPSLKELKESGKLQEIVDKYITAE